MFTDLNNKYEKIKLVDLSMKICITVLPTFIELF